VYVSGSKYQHYTYTSLISILENSKPEERNEPIRFTIIYEEMGPKGELLFKGILDNDMTRLTNVLFLLFNRDIYKYDIEYIPIPDRERERISKFKSYKWPKSIFLKLFFSNFLSYDKCIYLDGDTACVNDIRRLWNINLGEYCFGGCIYQWFNKILAVNAGSLLYDLKKMRGVGFSDKIGEILRQKQKNSTNFVETLEEGALYAYSKKYGHCVIDQEFNTILNVTPRDIKTKHPTIIHYSGVSKPDANRVQQYEAAGCPSFEDTKNNFWETTWKHNPWSFWIWYEHYKKYREIENLANLD
jgi:lipopolysaccharide biosynthesis glycosyltransferase